MLKLRTSKSAKTITLDIEPETADLIANLKKEWDANHRGKTLSWVVGLALDEALRAYESNGGLCGSGGHIDGSMIWSVPRLQVMGGTSHHAEALTESAAIERVLSAATLAADTMAV